MKRKVLYRRVKSLIGITVALEMAFISAIMPIVPSVAFAREQTETSDLEESEDGAEFADGAVEGERAEIVEALGGSSSSIVPSNALEYGGHYYKFYEKSASWKDAKAICENLGGHLVTVNSEGEQKFIATNWGDNHFWIGLTEDNAEHTWQWVTYEKLDYTNWLGGQPDKGYGDTEQYAICRPIPGRGKWDDRRLNGDPGKGYSYVCEWVTKLLH